MRDFPSLNALRIFEELSKYKSISDTANSLRVTQGAVSRQLKHLEAYLGVKLVERSPRGIELNTTGEYLAKQLSQCFDQIEIAVQTANKNFDRITLNILTPPTWSTRWLSARLHNFYILYPNIKIRITTIPNAGQMDEYDCYIRFGIGPRPKYETSTLLALEHHIAVASPNIFLNGTTPNLHQHALLQIMHDGKRLPIWENWLARACISNIDTQNSPEFSTLDQAIHIAVAGGGIAIIDQQMIQPELKSGSLKKISDICYDGPYGYWLDIPQTKMELPKIRLFHQWIKDMYEAERIN
jgi:Transcriptional regulator